MGRDYGAIATAYARDVVEGRIPAGRYHRLACQRHLRDLERQGTRDFPYVFSSGQAYRYCAFVETMPHVAGRWARGQLLKLEPWQVFIEASVHGWVHKDTGLRRFRLAYEEVPRKNGKSTRMAAKGLYMLTEEGEPGAEVYCGATTEYQATKVFDPAKRMARKNDLFRRHYGVEVQEQAIFVQSTGSKMMTMIGNPGDGDSPSCAIIDEYHEHRTSGQFDTMVSGTGAREQPLVYVITTAGYSLTSPCYALRKEAIGILDGTFVDETFFAIIFHSDEDDDWQDPIAYRKANPNLGVSVSEEYLQGQLEKAKRSTQARVVYLTKHLNRWVQAGQPFFDVDAWLRAPVFDLEEMEGEPCMIGLDLASRRDLAALVAVFRSEEKWRIWSRFWLPAARVREVKTVPYQDWVDRGWIVETPGDIIDLDMIEDEIIDFASRFEIIEGAHDPFQATQLVAHLMDRGIKMVEVGQGFRTMSEPMKVLDALIRDGKVEHCGNGCMAWNIANVQAKFVQGSDHARPVKEREEEKIDGAVAAIMAMNRWIAADAMPTSRPWWEQEDASFVM